jgi:hypothetical protein
MVPFVVGGTDNGPGQWRYELGFVARAPGRPVYDRSSVRRVLYPTGSKWALSQKGRESGLAESKSTDTDR